MNRLNSDKAGGARPGGVVAISAVAALAFLGALFVAVAAGSTNKPGANTAAPAPQTPKKGMWGVTEVNGESIFPAYRDLGVGLFSHAARWDLIAPTTRPANPTDPNDPAYVWPEYLTDSIAEADANGMQVQIMVLGTPQWANGGQSWQFTPDQTSDYGDFATAISKRYPSVDLWMVWGEPNRKPNFEPFTPARRPTGPLSKAEQVAPKIYAQLLDSAYGGFETADPKDKVIGGNTYTSAGRDDINPYQWIRYMRLPDGSRPRMDMWGHNPFGFDVPNLKDPPSPRGTVAFADLKRLAKALDKTFPGPRLKLFLAEWGVPVGFKDKDLLYSLKPKEAREWIKAGFKIVRSYKRVYSLGWIHPIDTDRSSMGLLDANGKRKATYNAFKAG